ncbi:MAG: allantoinase AllB [Rhodobacterales bacterium]|nr:allantoinase AllB [Rhodobacterales bacterium]
MKFALHSRRVLLDGHLKPATVVVRGGRIDAILDEVPTDLPVEMLGDRVLMAGLVDTHVHINEPGRTEWEGFETATRAAAAGGITTVVDMPLNCIPVTTSDEALTIKRRASAGRLWVDCGFWGGVVPGNADQLRPMVENGICGFKAFLCHSGIDDFPNATEADLRIAMPILAELGVPLLVHAELDLGAPEDELAPQSYAKYLASRPKRWEDEAIAMMIRLVRDTGCRVHIVHLSSSTALPLLAAARAEGLPITVETCPHYLCLTAQEVPDCNTAYKCSPPIREAENRELLWKGLADGIIDFVISDHSPCTPHLKLPERGDFMDAWGGIASLQLGLSNIWTEAQQRGFSIADVSRWMSQAPADFLGFPAKGRLAVGADADLIAWSPEETWTIAEGDIFHRHKVTPYLGRSVQGRVHRTWLRGERVWDGQHHGPSGKALARTPTAV